MMDLLVYDLKVSAAEIRNNYYSAIQILDQEFQEVLKKIYIEYEELHLLTRNAYNTNLSATELSQNSIKLAKKLNVKEEKILRTKQDVLNFFNN